MPCGLMMYFDVVCLFFFFLFFFFLGSVWELSTVKKYSHSSRQYLLAAILSPQHCGHVPEMRTSHSI